MSMLPYQESDPNLFYPKELSWLAFNERVLQEAEDEVNPIIERIRFLGIYSSNLDEFYRVRVANLRRQILIEKNQPELTQNAGAAKELMAKLIDKIASLTQRFDRAYRAVFKELKEYNIHLVGPEHLTLDQVDWLRSYFKKEVLIHIAPILVDKKTRLISRLNDSAAYLWVALNDTHTESRYATIEVPSDKTSRFIILPKKAGSKQIILLEDVISLFLDVIFKGFIQYQQGEAYSFKMTRDSDYYLDEGIDESYLDKMSDSVKQRLSAEPVRVVFDADMPPEMLKELKRFLKHSSYDNFVPAGKIRNVKDFIGFPNIGRKNLENEPLEPLFHPLFTHSNTVFEAIKESDILLYYPYYSFLQFTEFVRQAAFDPQVKHIRITLYRVASDSRIISSLIDAVDNGKLVTVVMELRARFDEEANISWTKKLTDSGVRVLVGNPAFKIHTKVCVVSREEQGSLTHYTHIGTGNFNEKTARLYTDFSLFTCSPDIGREALQVFEMIHLPYRPQRFRHLLVSPINAKSEILNLMDIEIANSKRGISAEILFKVNNLVDHDIVSKLYEAHAAGVRIRGVVRGMCSLLAGVKGLSDNIQIISVVDRFLEHPRVMLFANGGEWRAFISSADWMKRNMDDRIEVGAPILNPDHVKFIKQIIEFHFRDTMKARVLDKNQENRYVKRGNRRKLQSQIEIYHFIKGLIKLESDTLRNRS